VREILAAIGDDPEREGLRETPQRVARAYREMFAGIADDVERHLDRTFEHVSDQVVIVGGINFSSVCEHHLLPFLGKAHIAYLPGNARVLGLSKLARTVDVFARRPQLQERLTEQVADSLHDHLSPRGVCVLVEAEHLCMRIRGAGKPCALTTTLAVRGVYRTDAAARAEVLSLMRNQS
jgi:GTP cyclohydrolase I